MQEINIEQSTTSRFFGRTLARFSFNETHFSFETQINDGKINRYVVSPEARYATEQQRNNRMIMTGIGLSMLATTVVTRFFLGMDAPQTTVFQAVEVAVGTALALKGSYEMRKRSQLLEDIRVCEVQSLEAMKEVTVPAILMFPPSRN